MIVAVFLLGLALGQNAYTGDIWPLPQMVNKGEKIFQINADQFTFTAGMATRLNYHLFLVMKNYIRNFTYSNNRY